MICHMLWRSSPAYRGDCRRKRLSICCWCCYRLRRRLVILCLAVCAGEGCRCASCRQRSWCPFASSPWLYMQEGECQETHVSGFNIAYASSHIRFWPRFPAFRPPLPALCFLSLSLALLMPLPMPRPLAPTPPSCPLPCTPFTISPTRATP